MIYAKCISTDLNKRIYEGGEYWLDNECTDSNGDTYYEVYADNEKSEYLGRVRSIHFEILISKDAHYFISMHPLEGIPELGLFYKSSNTLEKIVECEIVEDRYKIDDGYKVTLKALDENYGFEHYYQSDFVSLIERGIIIKVEPGMHVEFKTWKEPLCGQVFIEHAAYVVCKNGEEV